MAYKINSQKSFKIIVSFRNLNLIYFCQYFASLIIFLYSFPRQPGETSPNFSASGPSTGDLSDIEVLGYDYQILTNEGKEYFIEYNVKTDIYTILEHNY